MSFYFIILIEYRLEFFYIYSLLFVKLNFVFEIFYNKKHYILNNHKKLIHRKKNQGNIKRQISYPYNLILIIYLFK